jgi:hypothetical protein
MSVFILGILYIIIFIVSNTTEINCVKIGAAMFRSALQCPTAPTKSILLFADSWSLLWRQHSVKVLLNYEVVKKFLCLGRQCSILR